MKRSLDMIFAGTCLMILAYMTLSILGFYDGKCILGLGVIALSAWAVAREDDK